jgi:hypothetical protein
MSIVVLTSAKGSPGVSTTTLALASWWKRPLILMEADPAGGDLAARLGMPEEPGLVGLAASMRRRPRGQTCDQDWLADYVQQSPSGAPLLLAPAGSHQATSALNLLAAAAPLPLPSGTDLLVDIGRATGPTGPPDQATHRSVPPAWTSHGSTYLMVWICRPHLSDLAHLAATLSRQSGDLHDQAIVLSGTGPYPADEVEDTLGLSVLGHLPADSPGAAALWTNDRRKWSHCPLGRASKTLAAAIVADISQKEEGEINVTTAPDPSPYGHPHLREAIGDAS